MQSLRFFSDTSTDIIKDILRRYLNHSDLMNIKPVSRSISTLINQLPHYHTIVDLKQLLIELGVKLTVQLEDNTEHLYSKLLEKYAGELKGAFIKLDPVVSEYSIPEIFSIEAEDISLMQRVAPHLCAIDKKYAGYLLNRALEEKIFTLASQLIKHAAEISTKTFLICASQGYAAHLKEILQITQAVPEAKPQTALMIAAMNAKSDCVELLLPFSDVNQQTREGYTALMYCIVYTKKSKEESYLACAEKILAQHPDLSLETQEDNVNKTAYALACEKGLQKIADAIAAKMAPAFNRAAF